MINAVIPIEKEYTMILFIFSSFPISVYERTEARSDRRKDTLETVTVAVITTLNSYFMG